MIPRRLVRTVPEVTTEETEENWNKSISIVPDWEHVTHRDPIDPELFPLTEQYWEDCQNGAQKAGLIRLEDLYWHGGVYIDSDYILTSPIDSLLHVPAFAAWEDSNTIPDAVLGFEPKHPLLDKLIEEAVYAVVNVLGAWESGPGVITRNLRQPRNDVLVLPPDSFYPIHWSHKNRYFSRPGMPLLNRTLNAKHYAYGYHLWRHSWKGS